MKWRLFAATLVLILWSGVGEADCPESMCTAGGPCSSANCVDCAWSFYLGCNTCVAITHGDPYIPAGSCGCSQDPNREECCENNVGYCYWCGGQNPSCCCWGSLMANGMCAPSPWEPIIRQRSKGAGPKGVPTKLTELRGPKRATTALAHGPSGRAYRSSL